MIALTVCIAVGYVFWAIGLSGKIAGSGIAWLSCWQVFIETEAEK